MWYITNVDKICAIRRGVGSGPLALGTAFSRGPRGDRFPPRTHWVPLLDDGSLAKSALCGFRPSMRRGYGWPSGPDMLPMECHNCRRMAMYPSTGIRNLTPWELDEEWAAALARGHRRIVWRCSCPVVD